MKAEIIFMAAVIVYVAVNEWRYYALVKQFTNITNALKMVADASFEFIDGITKTRDSKVEEKKDSVYKNAVDAIEKYGNEVKK